MKDKIILGIAIFSIFILLTYIASIFWIIVEFIKWIGDDDIFNWWSIGSFLMLLITKSIIDAIIDILEGRSSAEKENCSVKEKRRNFNQRIEQLKNN